MSKQRSGLRIDTEHADGKLRNTLTEPALAGSLATEVISRQSFETALILRGNLSQIEIMLVLFKPQHDEIRFLAVTFPAPTPTHVTGAESTPSHAEKPDDPLTLEAILKLLEHRHQQIFDALEPIVQDVQEDLQALAGTRFATLDENKMLAATIMRLLDQLQLRVKCRAQGCVHPAIIRCSSVARSKVGFFQFEHSAEGKRTKHGQSRDLPFIELVEPSEDGRETIKATFRQKTL